MGCWSDTADFADLCPALQLETAGHYTVYALEGRGGEVRWHHAPGDFQMHTAYQPVSGVMNAQTNIVTDMQTCIMMGAFTSVVINTLISRFNRGLKVPHKRTCTCIQTCTNMCTYVQTNLQTYRCTHTNMFIHVHAFKHVQTYMYIHTSICTNIHVHTYKHMYKHTRA